MENKEKKLSIFMPDKADYSKYLLNLVKNNKAFRFQLGMKMNVNTRSKDPVKHCAEILSGMTLLNIGNVFSALKNVELILEVNEARYECLDKLINQKFDESVLLLGGSKTIRTTRSDGESETTEISTFKLNSKIIEGIYTNTTPPVGTELVEQMMIPMKFPEEFGESSIEEFELIKARVKLSIERKMTLSQKRVMLEYQNSDKRVHILDGCVRAGKSYISTYLALLDIEDHINQKKSGQIVFIGVSASSCYTNIFKGIINEVFELDIPSPHSFIWKLANLNIRIIGSNVESMQGLRGITAARIFVDEANNALNTESAMAVVETRMAKPGVRLMMTCNPSSPTHFIYDRYLKDPSKYEELSLARYHFNLPDEIKQGNPHVDEKFAKHLGDVFGVDSAQYKKDVLGEWVGADEAVYHFSEDRNVIKESLINLKKYEDIYIGVDQGTNSPKVYIMIGVYVDLTTGKKKVDVIDELYYQKGHIKIKKYDDYISDLEEFVKPVRNKLRAIYTPHDAGDLKLLLRDKMKLPAELATQKTKVEEGIGMVQQLLSSDFMKISSKCKNLIREMMTYQFEVKDGIAGEKRQKKDDHAPDALRYAVTSCKVYCSGTYEMYKYLVD